LLFSAVVFATFGALVYGGAVVWRSTIIYRCVKDGQRGWVGNIHRPDAELGCAVVPGGSGAEFYAIGPNVPSRIGEDGFRVPCEAPLRRNSAAGIKVLALGCSFTFGSTCLAEESYPYLIASELDAECLNAGLCSAGLAQMEIQGRRLIPKHRPQIVLVQYSPWLVERSIVPFAPTYWGTCPCPYYYDAGGGGHAIQPPVFTASETLLSAAKYRSSERGMKDFLSFFFEIGLPNCVYEDACLSKCGLMRAAGLVPRPSTDKAGIIQDVYGELHRQCKSVGARMVIVGMRESLENESPLPTESFPAGVDVVETREALVANLSDTTPEAWNRAYYHWCGNPPVCIDGHPNQRAHRIIADVVLERAFGNSQLADRRSSPDAGQDRK
jgi:hypothetical protein